MSQSIPAVGYARRSTDKQESSIPEQVKAVQQYADEHGYRILRWYTDDAISGDDTKKRLDFLRMLEDAQQQADFKAILCWDQDRFGRFSPHEASYRTWPLAQAGVRLVTVDKGPIDWTDFTEWLTYSVNQHGKHQFLKDLSRNVARGQLDAANNGSWVGSPPYAYRLEGPKKHKRLILDDPVKARIVQRIFREYVEEGRSMMNIADRLNKEGVLSAGGRMGGWRGGSVRVILENPAYTGDYAGCRYSYGKYHTNHRGSVVKANGKRIRRPASEWVVRPDNHEAIIDRATFEKAQAILAGGKTGRSPYTPETNPYVLSCLLRCGRPGCGCVLNGLTNGKYNYYECGNRKYNGKDACEGTTVRERDVLRSVADHLENWLGFDGEALGAAAYYGALKDGDELPEAFHKIKALITSPAAPKHDRERLEKQAEQLTATLAKAKGNLVLLDADNIPAAQDRIRQLGEELAAVERELKQSKPPAEKDVNAVVLEVLNNLYALAYCCRSLARPGCVDEKGRRGVDNGDGTVTWGSLEAAAPKAVKRLLNRTSHIVCHTVRREGKASKKRGATGTRHQFERGEIVFSGVGPVASNPDPDLAD